MGAKVRTEPSPEFTEQSGGHTKVSQEFLPENARGRTRMSEDFSHDGGGLPVDRFVPPYAHRPSLETQVGRPDPRIWGQAKLAEAERHEFTLLGQVSQIILGPKRDIEFGKFGPLIGLNRSKQLVINTPVYSLPPRHVLVDKRGKPVWNVEKLDDRARARALTGSSIEEQRLNVTAYAETGRYQGFYVIQPLMQILFTTVDPSRRQIFLNFFPGSNGNYPVLLFDPQTKRLTVWGGGGYIFA